MVNPSVSCRMMIVCHYVISVMLLFTLVEFHPANCLPINPDITQDAKEAKCFTITDQVDPKRSGRMKAVDPVKSISVSFPLLWRIRRAAGVFGEALATALPEKSTRKNADNDRNSYYNRSGWGGGYGRRR